jgi:mono/diheme cytochrome c family protein
MHIKSIFFAAVLGLGMTGSSPVFAQQGDAGDLGEKSYIAYCSDCHGLAGAGGGSLQPLLNVEIANLTELSANNGGVFPMLDVIHTIDGRSGLPGHEGPMPTFGYMFDPGIYGPPHAAEAVIRGQMLSIALYLESIQK